MKLRKDQRYTAYIIMLAEFDNHFYTEKCIMGFCYLIYELFGIDNTGFGNNWNKNGIQDVCNFFPEFKYSINWPSSYTDEGKIFRKELLKQCIADTEDF